MCPTAVGLKVVSSLFLVACVQVLVEKQGLANYFDLDSEVSQIFMTSIYMGMYYLAVHAFLLYRLRYNVMDVYQLKHLCFYKFLVNLLVPLFWLPEFDPMIHVDKRVTLGTRLLMATIYWLGYHFAGVGDNVGRILVGEKAD